MRIVDILGAAGHRRYRVLRTLLPHRADLAKPLLEHLRKRIAR